MYNLIKFEQFHQNIWFCLKFSLSLEISVDSYYEAETSLKKLLDTSGNKFKNPWRKETDKSGTLRLIIKFPSPKS